MSDCSICPPGLHDKHTDDSYGACGLCREFVAHTDEEMRLVAWPCAVVREERLREALEEIVDLYTNNNIRPATFAVRAGEIAVSALKED